MITRAFSSEVEAGSREENATKQKDRAPLRFNRNGKGSSAAMYYKLQKRGTRFLAACIVLMAVATSIGMVSVRSALAVEPISIGTGSPGGFYLLYGQGLTHILSRELGQEITAQATQGPAQNIVLLEKGEVQLAFITMGVGLQAWNRLG